jgi:hypothetical protein
MLIVVGHGAQLVANGADRTDTTIASSMYNKHHRVEPSDDDSLWLADATGAGRRLLAERATRSSWFPDGEHLAVQIGDQLFIADTRQSALRQVADLRRESRR